MSTTSYEASHEKETKSTQAKLKALIHAGLDLYEKYEKHKTNTFFEKHLIQEKNETLSEVGVQLLESDDSSKKELIQDEYKSVKKQDALIDRIKDERKHSFAIATIPTVGLSFMASFFLAGDPSAGGIVFGSAYATSLVTHSAWTYFYENTVEADKKQYFNSGNYSNDYRKTKNSNAELDIEKIVRKKVEKAHDILKHGSYKQKKKMLKHSPSLVEKIQDYANNKSNKVPLNKRWLCNQ